MRNIRGTAYGHSVGANIKHLQCVNNRHFNTNTLKYENKNRLSQKRNVMDKIKQLQKWIPELYLLLSATFYWVSTEKLFNPIGFFLLVVLTTLFLWRNEILGIIISSLFLILSLYMVLALISELNQFPAFNQDALVMFLVGGIWLSLNIILSITMIIKWGKQASFSQIATTETS